MTDVLPHFPLPDDGRGWRARRDSRKEQRSWMPWGRRDESDASEKQLAHYCRRLEGLLRDSGQALLFKQRELDWTTIQLNELRQQREQTTPDAQARVGELGQSLAASERRLDEAMRIVARRDAEHQLDLERRAELEVTLQAALDHKTQLERELADERARRSQIEQDAARSALDDNERADLNLQLETVGQQLVRTVHELAEERARGLKLQQQMARAETESNARHERDLEAAAEAAETRRRRDEDLAGLDQLRRDLACEVEARWLEASQQHTSAMPEAMPEAMPVPAQGHALETETGPLRETTQMTQSIGQKLREAIELERQNRG